MDTYNLYAVWDEKIPNVKGHFLSCKNLGGDHLPTFEANLNAFFDKQENEKYLHHVMLALPESKKHLSTIINKVVNQKLLSYGDYDDGLFGLSTFFKNLPNVIKYPNILQAEIKPGFQALAIMAGPSLDGQFKRLKELADTNKFLVLCCDASYEQCLKKGITPHVVLTFERAGTEGFFKEVDHSKSILVASNMAAPGTFESYTGSKSFFLRNQPDTQILKLPPPQNLINTTPGVASCSHGVLRSLGASKIYFAGLDLVYSDDGSSHAVLGSKVGIEHNIKYKNPKSIHEVICNDGKIRKATTIWCNFVNELQMFIKVYDKKQKCKIFTFSSMAQKIQGVEFRDINSLNLPKKEFQGIKMPKFNSLRSNNLKAVKVFLKGLERELKDKKSLTAYQWPTLRYLNHIATPIIKTAFVKFRSDLFHDPANKKSHEEVFMLKFNNMLNQIKNELNQIKNRL